MKVVWLKGDYTGRNKKERQRQAERERCDIVIEFHFNASDNASASGTEVWYHNHTVYSQKLAKILHDNIIALGFKPRGVKSAVDGSRASFINSYPRTCWVVLLEPCFVTKKEDAAKVHDEKFMQRLAEAIANGISKLVKENGLKTVNVIGLSVGHKYKTFNPIGKGAQCVRP